MKTLEQLRSIKPKTTKEQREEVIRIVHTIIEFDYEVDIVANGFHVIQERKASNGPYTYRAGLKRLPLNQLALFVRVCETLQVPLHQNLIEA